MVWGIAKNKVAKENKVFKLDETKQLVTQALDSMQPSTFKACFKHTEKVENDYWTRDGLSCAPVIDSFVLSMLRVKATAQLKRHLNRISLTSLLTQQMNQKTQTQLQKPITPHFDVPFFKE